MNMHAPKVWLATALAAIMATTGRGQSTAQSTVADDETVQLSPFEVRAEQDTGYAASTAMSGTRTNEKLENLPNSITVMTSELLQDLAFTNYFDAVDFAVNAENIANDLGTVGAPVAQRAGNQVSFRGLSSMRQLRDGFPWYLAVDTFNTERIEFSRGPGGLAYGDVDAGGIINVATKRANFRRRASVQVRYDSFGSQRYSLDVNQPLVPGRVTMRFNAVKSEIEQWKQRQGRDLEAYAGALRIEPFKHKRTQIDIFGEVGNGTYHLGHLGPTDSRAAYVMGSGTNAADADPNRPGVQASGVGMKIIQPANSSNHALVEHKGVIYSLQSTPTTIYRISTLNEGANAASGTDPQNPLRIPLTRVPDSIIPYREDWAGPDNKQLQKYRSYTIEFKHSFANRLNLLLAHNGQRDDVQRKQAYSNIAALTGVASRSVYIDVNRVIPNPNGTGTIPNPNFEKLFTVYAMMFSPDGHDLSNWRGQLVYDLDLPWRITQRIAAGANYRHEKYYSDAYSVALTPEEMARRGYTGAGATFQNNMVAPIHYLHDGNSDAELGWNIQPGVTQFFRYGANNGINRRLDQSLSSASVTILGSYFGGKLRSTIGVSREHWIQSASLPPANNPTTNALHYVNLDGSLIENRGIEHIETPLVPFADQWSTNQTFGAVWHAHKLLTLTSGYFESSQFSDNYGLDLTGNAAKPLTGEGFDLSARIHLFDGKIEPSITYFQTTQENVTANISGAVRTELTPYLNAPLVNTVDYRDRSSQGWEYQLLMNLTRNWTLIGHYSTNKTRYSRFFPLLDGLIAEARQNAAAQGVDPDDATTETRDWLQEQEGNISETRRETASLTTRYSFTQGALKGFTVGVSGRYQKGKEWNDVTVGGQEIFPATRTEDVVLVNPFFAYRRKFGRTDWTFQMNINNLFDEQTNQGNSYRWPRLIEPRQFIYTATVAF